MTVENKNTESAPQNRVLLSYEDIQYIYPFFKSKFGIFLLKTLYSFVGIDKINKLYYNSSDKNGPEFISSVLRELGITYRIHNEEILKQLPQGNFITISNHPYGALDGLILIHLIASYRPDYKVMVNWILTYIKTMNENFIAVEPTPNKSRRQISMNGLRESLAHVKEGHPIGFFPAGSVAKIRHFHIEEQEWQPTITRLIKRFEIPVVPIYFHGHNSLFYNLLGLIHWKVRTVRLPAEVFNKQNTVFDITVGEPISVEQQRRFNDIDRFGEFLRNETLKLKNCK